MPNAYIKFAGLAGPLNLSGDAALPPGQPAGVSLDGVFRTDAWQSGVSLPTDIFASGTTGAGAGKSTAQDFGISLSYGSAYPALFLAAAAGTVYDTVAVVSTLAATGGIATEWVSSYWLLRDAQLSSLQTYGDGGNSSHALSVTYGAALLATFAPPSGGQLGARTMAGFDWVENKPWTGA